MLTYFIVFIISLFFYRFAVRKNNKNIVLPLVVVLLVLSTFAGVRDETVGTDMSVYVVRIWDMFLDVHTFQEVIITSVLSETEFGYSIFNYMISRITSDIHWFLFAHQLLICLITLYIGYKERDNIPTGYVLMFYLLGNYVTTFNLMRQSCAIACVLLAFYWAFYQDKKILAFVAFLLGWSFHNSVILAILLPISYYLFAKFQFNPNTMYIGGIVVTLLLYISFRTFMGSLLNYGILSSKYEMYTDQSGYSSHKALLALYLYFFLLISYLRKFKYAEGIKSSFCQFASFIAVCLFLLGDQTEVANRIASYFTIPMFLLPSSVVANKQRQVYWYVLIPMLVVWVYLGVTTGLSDCVPYTSKILGINP